MSRRLISLRHGLAVVVAVAAVFLSPMLAVVEAKSAQTARVAPVQSRPYGATYGEWSARWWQWALSLPIDRHPLYDTADCSAGQTGRVWFLGGAFTAHETSQGLVANRQRTCTIPAGTALFIPIINTEASAIEYEEASDKTEAALRAAAKAGQDLADVATMSITIDGQPVQNLGAYRVVSPAYTIGPLPENNILQAFDVDAPAGSTSLSVADGVYVLVRPLPVGEHTIHFHGEMHDEAQKFHFLLDITYTITVAPRGQ